MQNDPINTAPIKQFISMVKSADASRAKEVRIDMDKLKEYAESVERFIKFVRTYL